MSEEQSTILVLPDGERGEQLGLKLEEYKIRLSYREAIMRRAAPELRQDPPDDWYAWYILDALVSRKQIDSFALSREMYVIKGKKFNPDKFDRRFRIIESYVENGEAHGRLLPPIKRES